MIQLMNYKQTLNLNALTAGPKTKVKYFENGCDDGAPIKSQIHHRYRKKKISTLKNSLGKSANIIK